MIYYFFSYCIISYLNDVFPESFPNLYNNNNNDEYVIISNK